MITMRNEESARQSVYYTYKVGSLNGVSYSDILRVLGEPTFNEPSSDGKTQIEWVVAHKADVFTVYDWKTFDLDYTLNQLNNWSVGGKSDPTDFIREFRKQLEEKLHSRLYSSPELNY